MEFLVINYFFKAEEDIFIFFASLMFLSIKHIPVRTLIMQIDWFIWLLVAPFSPIKSSNCSMARR